MPEIASLSVGIGADTAAFQTALANVQASLARVGEAVGMLGAPMAGLAGTSSAAAGAATGLAGAEAAAAGGAGEMAAAMPAATAATGGMTAAVGGLRGAIGSLMTMMAPLLAAFSAIAAVKMGLGFSADIETANVQFEVLLGSTEKAEARVKELYDFAAKTPFQFPEVLAASKLLQTFGGTALATGVNLTMVGDMASASGAQFSEIAMWVGRAYDAIQTGRPFGEAAMRLQELGLMTGATRNKLEQLNGSGQKGDAVWKVFTDSMGRYTGMMDKMSVTFTGLLSTVMDTLNQALGKLAGPLFAALKGAMPGVISALGGVGPALDSLGAAIADMGTAWETNFGGIREIVAGVVAFIMPYIERVRTTFTDMWAKIGALAGPAFANIMAWLRQFVGFIQSAVMPLLPPLWEAFKLTFDAIANAVNIAFILVRSVIETVLAVIGGDFAAVGKIWEGAFKDIWGSIINIFNDTFAKIGATIGPLMGSIGDAIGAEFGKIGGIIGAEFGKIGRSIGDTIGRVGEMFGEALGAIGAGIGAVLGGIIRGIATVAFIAIIAVLTLLQMAFGDTLGAIGAAIGGLMGNIGGMVGPVMGAIGEAMGAGLGLLGQMWGDAFGNMGASVGAFAGTVGTSLGDLMASMGELVGAGMGVIGTAFGDAWTTIQLTIGGALGNIGMMIGGFMGDIGTRLGAWLTEQQTTVSTAVQGLTDKLAEIFKVAGESFAGIWNSITETIKGAINSVIDMLNGFIGKMNEFIGQVNASFGWLGELPMVGEIPRLEAGGIVTRPTLAMLGESGPEAIVPLGAGGFGGGVITVQGDVYMDSQKVGRVVWDDLKHRAGAGFALGLA